MDIEKELKRMAKDFGLTDKEVASNWRSLVRFAWGKSIFRQKFYTKNAVSTVNTNPRSMKRFPTVTKYECSICKGMFTGGAIEIDHKVSENKMTELSHSEDFLKVILFSSPEDMQILCKDKKKKVKGKFQVERFGCHSIKTYQERYGVTFDEALLNKQIIDLSKSDERTLSKLIELGTSKGDIPKTKKAKKELLNKLMRGV